MSKALLVLFGGRSIPNVLTMIYEKPDLIVPIISKDMMKQLPDFVKLVNVLFTDEKPIVNTNFEVDAFDIDDTRNQCLNVVHQYPQYEWTFNITSGTTIMSIGAYEAAKALEHEGSSINCWYMDTKDTKVVSLSGPRIADESIYDLSVDHYVAAYNCRLEPNKNYQRNLAEEKWLPFAVNLVQRPENIAHLKAIMLVVYEENQRRAKARRDAEDSGHLPITANPQEYTLEKFDGAYPLLEAAYNIGLLNKLDQQGEVISLNISPEQFGFLNGFWLEVYVWNEINKLQRFTDCQWNQLLFHLDRPLTGKNLNELDIFMIYKAQMFFVECKSGREVFKPSTLDTFDSVANTLGGSFVTKILVTSLPALSDESSAEHFLDRAHARRIVLVARDDLARVGEIIAKEIKEPEHMRQ